MNNGLKMIRCWWHSILDCWVWEFLTNILAFLIVFESTDLWWTLYCRPPDAFLKTLYTGWNYILWICHLWTKPSQLKSALMYFHVFCSRLTHALWHSNTNDGMPAQEFSDEIVVEHLAYLVSNVTRDVLSMHKQWWEVNGCKHLNAMTRNVDI